MTSQQDTDQNTPTNTLEEILEELLFGGALSGPALYTPLQTVKNMLQAQATLDIMMR